MYFSFQFVDKDRDRLDMTIYGKNFLFVLQAWNSGSNSILACKIQTWYRLNSQKNCFASTRAQISPLLASYHIWSEYSYARIPENHNPDQIWCDGLISNTCPESSIILIQFCLWKKSPNTFFLLKNVITSWTYIVWSWIILIHYDSTDKYTYWLYLLIYEPECFK